MIVVKVDLHSAVTNKITHLASMVICNDGTGDVKYGNYLVKLISKNLNSGRTAQVTKHNRNGLSIWVLVAKAIKALYKAAPELIIEGPKEE